MELYDFPTKVKIVQTVIAQARKAGSAPSSRPTEAGPRARQPPRTPTSCCSSQGKGRAAVIRQGCSEPRRFVLDPGCDGFLDHLDHIAHVYASPPLTPASGGQQARRSPLWSPSPARVILTPPRLPAAELSTGTGPPCSHLYRDPCWPWPCCTRC